MSLCFYVFGNAPFAPPAPYTQKMAGRSSGVVRAAAAGRQRWQCWGVDGGASVDIVGGIVGIGGSGGGTGTSTGAGRGGAAALASLGLPRGWAADAQG